MNRRMGVLKTVFLVLFVFLMCPLEAGYELRFQQMKDPKNGSLRGDLLQDLKAVFELDAFIETGTYLGDTTEIARRIFPQVHTIELSDFYYKKAKARFKKCGNVQVVRGDSGAALAGLLNRVKGRALIYLDGHYSEGLTALGDQVTPIFKEIQAIKNSFEKGHVILIDDLRLFQDSLYAKELENTSASGYPPINLVIDWLLEINPDYQICCIGDALLAFSFTEKITVSPVLRACTKQRLSLHKDYSISEFTSDLQTIAQANGTERKQMIDYYHIFSDCEKKYGLRSFSSLWYAMLLDSDGKYEMAQSIVNDARAHSLPNWIVDWFDAQEVEKQPRVLTH